MKDPYIWPSNTHAAHWQRIDTAEREAGHAQGRPRIKIVDLDELRSVAAAAGD
ncbi:hypothetical protein [Gordonia zhaorongruii]|uniref:hypothetical protein n=1 Tax=Gordonia zhaorongruii TaxID=2597659 RepID=UPI001643458A|nr:hypothetical protein [Gordonia zhaorongruii]